MYAPALKMYLIINYGKERNYAEKNQLDDTIIIYIIHKNISKLFANDDIRDREEKVWICNVLLYFVGS